MKFLLRGVFVMGAALGLRSVLGGKAVPDARPGGKLPQSTGSALGDEAGAPTSEPDIAQGSCDPPKS